MGQLIGHMISGINVDTAALRRQLRSYSQSLPLVLAAIPSPPKVSPAKRRAKQLLTTIPRLKLAKDLDRPSRNAPCPCGSGKKFKKCCGAEA